MKKIAILLIIISVLLTSCIPDLFKQDALKLYWHINFPKVKSFFYDQATYFAYDELTGYLYVRFSKERTACMNLEKKEIVWTRYINSQSPNFLNLEIELYKDKVYVIKKNGETEPKQSLMALNKKDGSTIWEYPLYDDKIGAGICIYKGYIYLPDQKGKMGMLLKIDADTGKTVWINEDVEPVVTTRVVIDEEKNTAYIGTLGSYDIGVSPKLFAVDIETGKTVWKNNILDTDKDVVDVCTVPVIYGDSVYVATWYGDFKRIKRDTGETVWLKVFQESDGMRKNFGSGARLWLYKNKIITALTDGSVIKIDPENADIIWKTKKSYTIDDCYLKNDRVYIHSASSNITCFSAEDGKEIWSFKYEFPGTETGRAGGAPFKVGR